MTNLLFGYLIAVSALMLMVMLVVKIFRLSTDAYNKLPEAQGAYE